MAIVKRSEFAAICNTTTAVITTNVSRNKIETLPDKRIDTESPLNKVFVKLRKQKDARDNQIRIDKNKQNKSIEEKPEKKDVKIYSKELTPKNPRKTQKEIQEEKENSSLALRKLKADTLKAEKDNELKQMSLDKMAGKLIPLDLSNGILKINIQNIFKSFENELENIASIYCDILASGDRSKLSEVTEKMRENLSRIIKETKTNAAKEVEGIINEYAETRSRGERK